MHGLPFYHELSVAEVSKAFKKYARSYRVVIVDLKDPLVQLESSKSSIKDLFKDLLNERKGFKYQINVKILLSKEKENEDIQYAPVHLILKIILINLFNKLYTELIIGWDLVG